MHKKYRFITVLCGVALLLPCLAFGSEAADSKGVDVASDAVQEENAEADDAQVDDVESDADQADAKDDADQMDAQSDQTDSGASVLSGAMLEKPSEELSAWYEENDCATCHTVESDSFEDEACVASKHASLELSCIACHADDTLIELHEDVTADSKLPKKLKETSVPSETCESCHDSEALAETTADSTVLTDDEGTVVNPHAIPAIDEHDDIECMSCHKMHSDKSVEKVAADKCTDCHHENVYECYTCHS